MHAIILAAGRGSRLSPSNPDQRPKCLFEIGGRTLLARMLENLEQCGVSLCDIVIGYEGDRVVEHVETLALRPPVSFQYNPRFEEGSVVSLAAAESTLTAGGPVLLLDADVLFHPLIMRRLVGSESENCFLVDYGFEDGTEPVKIVLNNGVMIEFGKQLPASLVYDSLGESVGFFRFGADCAGRIAERCARFLRDGRADAPHEAALREEVLEQPRDFGVEDVTGLPWIEIDFSEDVRRACREVLPAIRADYPEY